MTNLVGTRKYSRSVMAGLVPAIHAFSRRGQDVDARDKRGHDGNRGKDNFQ